MSLVNAGVVASAIVPPGPPPDAETFTTSGTWTKPDGDWTRIRVTVIGGGGGGGAGGLTGGRAAGGGGGGSAEKRIMVIARDDLGATEAVTVGAGGAGAPADDPSSPAPAGSAGTASSFGSHCTANAGGGGGGGYHEGIANAPGGTGGTGGSGGSGGFSSVGSPGGAGGYANSGFDQPGVNGTNGSGAGGGCKSTNNLGEPMTPGGTGGSTAYATGGTAGAAGGGDGGNGGDSSAPDFRGGGGGGGGAQMGSSSNTAGAGGDAGIPGGGAGGGGGAVESAHTDVGGDGARGQVHVEYLSEPTVVEFVDGGHGSDTTWTAQGSTITTFQFSSLAPAAVEGDLAVIVLVRDATAGPGALVATPDGWTPHYAHSFFPKYLQVWTRLLDDASLPAVHSLVAAQDADNSKAWAVFRNVGSLSAVVTGYSGTTNPAITVDEDGSIAYTMVFETTNAAEPSAGSATRIGYSGTIRWEANLGTYYKEVGPTDTDGGVGGSVGFRYTMVMGPA